MDKVNEIMINDQKKKFEVKYIDNIDDNIIKLTNMICCNIFENTNHQYNYYKIYDMEDNFDKIKNIFINIKNNNIPDFNFIITILTNLLLELKANIVKIENDKSYYKQFTNSYYETNCLKTNQLKIWINKNIESEIKNKDLQSNILDIKLENEKLMKDIKELNNLVSKVSTNNKNLNNYYNKLNNTIKNSNIKLFNIKLENEEKLKKLNFDILKLSNINKKLFDQNNDLNYKNIQFTNQIEELNIKLTNQTEELNIKLTNQTKELNIKLTNQTEELNTLNNNYNILSENYNKLNNEFINLYHYYYNLPFMYNYYV